MNFLRSFFTFNIRLQHEGNEGGEREEQHEDQLGRGTRGASLVPWVSQLSKQSSWDPVVVTSIPVQTIIVFRHLSCFACDAQ